ncbi:hypothetical protein HY030_00600 [Candidatus Gottesmanbacteria bacterium]|nr:hypothetical protein [Candidatus Gottesmanbacteria bacterium]
MDNTEGSLTEEQEKLCLLLKEQQGILASLNKDKTYWRIRLKKESMLKFMDLIRKHVLPSFSYKLLS